MSGGTRRSRVRGEGLDDVVALLRAFGWPASGSTTGVDELPPAGILEQNFPNPFNPNTRIAFSLEKAGHVRLDIFDPAGRLVKTLVDEALPAARHEVSWNGRMGPERAAASGVYFYSIVRMETGTRRR